MSLENSFASSFSYYLLKLSNASVAQWIEQLRPKEKVASSTLARGTKISMLIASKSPAWGLFNIS